MTDAETIRRDATEPDRPFGPRSKIIAWRDGQVFVEADGMANGGVPIEKRGASVPPGIAALFGGG